MSFNHSYSERPTTEELSERMHELLDKINSYEVAHYEVTNHNKFVNEIEAPSVQNKWTLRITSHCTVCVEGRWKELIG